jgi:hypothetical protein
VRGSITTFFSCGQRVIRFSSDLGRGGCGGMPTKRIWSPGGQSPLAPVLNRPHQLFVACRKVMGRDSLDTIDGRNPRAGYSLSQSRVCRLDYGQRHDSGSQSRTLGGWVGHRPVIGRTHHTQGPCFHWQNFLFLNCWLSSFVRGQSFVWLWIDSGYFADQIENSKG